MRVVDSSRSTAGLLSLRVRRLVDVNLELSPSESSALDAILEIDTSSGCGEETVDLLPFARCFWMT